MPLWPPGFFYLLRIFGHTLLYWLTMKMRISLRRRSVHASSTKPENRTDSTISSDNDSVDGRRLKVRFSEQIEKSKAAANAKQYAVCWYTQEDLMAMKRSVAAHAQEIAMSPSETECSYRRTLKRIDAACTSASVEDSLKYDSFLSLKDQTDFTRIVTKGNSRSGIEMSVMDAMKLDRVKRRRRHCLALLQIQQELRDLPLTMKTAMIAQSLETLSRPARVFARELGRIQEAFGTGR